MAILKLFPDLIVFDFDGVLTDNAVYVMSDGKEAVRCNRSDGMAFDMFKRAKIEILILSTEVNPVVSKRAKKLSVNAIQGVDNKLKALSDYCKTKKISLSKVLYVGNDMNDFNVMKTCGLSACPSDSHAKIKALCKYKLKSKGGYGVARELAENVLGLRYV